MRLHLCRTIAAAAFVVLSGAAFADVTVSQSNDPTTLIGEQFASLFEAEHDAVNALPDARLSALANGTLRSGAARKPGDPTIIDYSDAWLAGLPEPTGDAQWECLRKALYFEARGETLQGQFAVAEVILNRVDSPDFPDTVCKVVNSRGSGACAFSYVCDGLRSMHEAGARDRAGRIARVMLDGAPRSLTTGATYFHARYVSPNWGRRVQTASIGAHLFYR